jgi:hypothetical protein
MAKLGLGATFKLHNGTILTSFAEVTAAKPPTPKGEAKENTSHAAVSDGVRTFQPGLLEYSDIVVKGFCNAGDATHALAIAQIAARTIRAYEMTVPGTSGGATGFQKFSGNCIPMEFDVGDAVPGELVEYTFTAKPSAAATEAAI